MRPPYDAQTACAASSMIAGAGAPREGRQFVHAARLAGVVHRQDRARSRRDAQFDGCGSTLKSSSQTSTSTGVAPRWTMTFTELAKVSGGTITSSPGPISKAASATSRPAVHELTAMACGAPTSAANAASNSLVRGPLVIQPERTASAAASASSSPVPGRL